jgi:hypothetical protein
MVTRTNQYDSTWANRCGTEILEARMLEQNKVDDAKSPFDGFHA